MDAALVEVTLGGACVAGVGVRRPAAFDVQVLDDDASCGRIVRSGRCAYVYDASLVAAVVERKARSGALTVNDGQIAAGVRYPVNRDGIREAGIGRKSELLIVWSGLVVDIDDVAAREAFPRHIADVRVRLAGSHIIGRRHGAAGKGEKREDGDRRSQSFHALTPKRMPDMWKNQRCVEGRSAPGRHHRLSARYRKPCACRGQAR